MKKVFALMLALVIVVSLASCGGGGEGGSQTYKVGDTAKGTICDITVNSVEFVDKIKDGITEEIWLSSGNSTSETKHYDITAKKGYSIAKIDYSFEFKGKEKGELLFGFALDYDGYTFDDIKENSEPQLETNGYGFEQKYTTGEQTYFKITDPMNFKGGKGVKYIIINDKAKEKNDKSLVLKVNVPTSTDVQTDDGSDLNPYDYPELDNKSNSKKDDESTTKTETFSFTVQ